MNPLRNRSETARIMLAAIGALYLVLLAAGLLVTLLIYPFEAPLAFWVGLTAGCLLSACKVVLLERAIGRSLDIEGKALVQGYASLQAALRYVLTIGVFVCVFLFRETVGLFGAILGVLTLQLSAYAVNPVLRRRERDGEMRTEAE